MLFFRQKKEKKRRRRRVSYKIDHVHEYSDLGISYDDNDLEWLRFGMMSNGKQCSIHGNSDDLDNIRRFAGIPRKWSASCLLKVLDTVE